MPNITPRFCPTYAVGKKPGHSPNVRFVQVCSQCCTTDLCNSGKLTLNNETLINEAPKDGFCHLTFITIVAIFLLPWLSVHPVGCGELIIDISLSVLYHRSNAARLLVIATYWPRTDICRNFSLMVAIYRYVTSNRLHFVNCSESWGKSSHRSFRNQSLDDDSWVWRGQRSPSTNSWRWKWEECRLA